MRAELQGVNPKEKKMFSIKTQDTIIIDLDGVCFDAMPRLERCKDAQGKIDWDRAFSNEEVMLDAILPGAPENVSKINKQFEIIYLTGRSKRCFDGTLEALRRGHFPVPTGFRSILEMRAIDDLRPDHEIKEETIKWLRMLPLNEETKYYNFIAAIDDDYSGKLKPMYEHLGIPCFLSFDEFFRNEIWKRFIFL
jgi:hypothetical protein